MWGGSPLVIVGLGVFPIITWIFGMHVIKVKLPKACNSILPTPREDYISIRLALELLLIETCSVSFKRHSKVVWGRPKGSPLAAGHRGDIQCLPQHQTMGETCSVSPKHTGDRQCLSVANSWRNWGETCSVSPNSGPR